MNHVINTGVQAYVNHVMNTHMQACVSHVINMGVQIFSVPLPEVGCCSTQTLSWVMPAPVGFSCVPWWPSPSKDTCSMWLSSHLIHQLSGLRLTPGTREQRGGGLGLSAFLLMSQVCGSRCPLRHSQTSLRQRGHPHCQSPWTIAPVLCKCGHTWCPWVLASPAAQPCEPPPSQGGSTQSPCPTCSPCSEQEAR